MQSLPSVPAFHRAELGGVTGRRSGRRGSVAAALAGAGQSCRIS